MKKIVSVILIIILLSTACSINSKNNDKKYIKQFFGVSKVKYTIVSTDYELGKKDYTGYYIAKIKIKNNDLGDFIAEINNAGYYLKNDEKELSSKIVKNIADKTLEEDDQFYHYMGSVKRKLSSFTKPKTVNGYIIYSKTNDDDYEIIMIYKEVLIRN